MGLLNQISEYIGVLNDENKNYNRDNSLFAKFFNKDKSITDSISNPFSKERNFVKFIKKYASVEIIEHAISTNPNIYAILDEYNIAHEYNLENVHSIIMSHLIPCANMARKVYKNMGLKESEKDFEYLIKAALLHDIGKAFIPSSILNKAGRLNSKERQIIELHNRLSYEILKTTDLDVRIAELAYEHHDYNNDVERNALNQALTISDIYCALKEKRPYKKAMNEICTKTIMYDMATKGKFDARYIIYI